ncbi:pyruvate kinase [Mycobacterium tuberculosis]|nr:pyruvate kinase [Mycobacterium tuberculosis]
MTRRGKIVCTLGPATQRDDLVRALVEAGMDVARMNFSHGDYDDHKVAYERVRVASDATGRAVGVLADLQGPKIRLGRFASGATHWAEPAPHADLRHRGPSSRPAYPPQHPPYPSASSPWARLPPAPQQA